MWLITLILHYFIDQYFCGYLPWDQYITYFEKPLMFICIFFRLEVIEPGLLEGGVAVICLLPVPVSN